MKKIKRIIKRTIVLLTRFIGLICPIQRRKICISSFEGMGFCDSPKYIASEVLNKSNCILFICGINFYKCDKKKYVNTRNIKFCDINSFAWEFHLLTSKLWIDNARRKFWHKKKKTVYINTWHGSGMQKKCEKDVEGQLNKEYVKMAIKDSKHINYFLSDCKALSNLIATSFWYSGRILETGLPRNQILTNNDNELKRKIKKSLHITEDAKIILFAPTFRNLNNSSFLNLNFCFITSSMENLFKNKVVVLLRLHPNVAGLIKIDENENVIDVSRYDDCQELLLISDILISDYSSIFHDFTIEGKLGIRLLLDDFGVDTDRGTYYPLDIYPWPIVYSIDELFKFLKKFEMKEYKMNLENFYTLIGLCDNTHKAASTVADIVCDICLNNFSEKEIEGKYKKYFFK